MAAAEYLDLSRIIHSAVRTTNECESTLFKLGRSPHESQNRFLSWNYSGDSRCRLVSFAFLCAPCAGADEKRPSSYSPVVIPEDFEKTVARMEAAKLQLAERQATLLHDRYDLSDRPAKGVTMSRGKSVQGGVRVKLPEGVESWTDLGAMSPEQIREKGAWPKGFLPLSHPNHAEGGMLFPKHHIDQIKKQEERDLTRFDLDYDLPQHFLPE